ncbi:MAG: queuosine precursor transporter [Chlamydiia bacterium]|nr:queuosine precursor transporter [Chlamydiia bacterium]MCH9616009.1 queuosine precursor transporter [Chlamydiia bacterium]MCH9629032.1 queuosine precursor transporter [Chlamydiia bacterium]
MINELIFFLHIGTLIGIVLLTKRYGKIGLISSFVLQVVLANLFVAKQITLFGLHVTGSDAFTISAFLTLAIVQQHYGKEAADNAVKASLVSLVFFLVMSQIHLLYQPSSFDTMHPAYKSILSLSPRIFASSLIVTVLAQKLSVELFHRLKLSNVVLKSALVISIAQAFDTIAFSYLGLYGIVGAIGEIILFSYLIKLIVIGTMTPLVTRHAI